MHPANLQIAEPIVHFMCEWTTFGPGAQLHLTMQISFNTQLIRRMMVIKCSFEFIEYNSLYIITYLVNLHV